MPHLTLHTCGSTMDQYIAAYITVTDTDVHTVRNTKNAHHGGDSKSHGWNTGESNADGASATSRQHCTALSTLQRTERRMRDSDTNSGACQRSDSG